MIVSEQVTEDLPPEEVYSLLANAMRVEIVLVLGEADGALAFSVLRERVGVRDSGGFNYHLQRLVGTFVERADDGYALTDIGERLFASFDD